MTSYAVRNDTCPSCGGRLVVVSKFETDNVLIYECAECKRCLVGKGHIQEKKEEDNDT